MTRFYQLKSNARHIFIERQGRWVEIAPLAGRSLETSALALSSFFTDRPTPAAQFAKEVLEEEPSSFSLPFCGLLFGNDIKEANRLASLGIRCVKVKLSGLEEREAHAILEHLLKRFSVRVDLNGTWDVKKANRFFAHYPQDAFEYIEEPCPKEQLDAFEYRLALDEHVASSLPRDVSIIKPTVTTVRKNEAIFSSALETSIGLYGIALLAKKYSPDQFIGIDTAKLLRDDALFNPFPIEEGRIHFNHPLEINYDRLQEIQIGNGSPYRFDHIELSRT